MERLANQGVPIDWRQCATAMANTLKAEQAQQAKIAEDERAAQEAQVAALEAANSQGAAE